MIRNYSQSNKTSNLPNGVSRFEEKDYRLAYPKIRIGYGVLVKVNGEWRKRKFRVSDKVSEYTARQTAIAYRKYYENYVNCGACFDEYTYQSFDDWQDGKYEDFEP